MKLYRELITFVCDAVQKEKNQGDFDEKSERDIVNQIKEMKSYEKIAERLQESYKCLAESGYITPANDLVQEASKNISSLQEYGQKYIELSERIESVAVELDDISKTISEYLSNGNFDADRLRQLDERADFIKDLFRKYGGDYERLNTYYNDISVKLNNLINSEALHKELLQNQSELLQKIEECQKDITSIRTKNAIEFSSKIQQEISLLGMPNACVQIKLSKRAESYTRKGCDLVEFMFSANIGFECKPLAKIASGGELSRFMLAYKIVVADLDEINTLIFDEIDTGLSGKMAGVVAECLAKLSRHKQVITISHLPQLASMADTNFRVEKFSDNSTHTRLTEIKDRELYFEIARHANEMAYRLRDGIAALGYPFPVPSPSNQQFPVLPNTVVERLQEMGYEFEIDHTVDETHTCVRFVTSWATPVSAIDTFLKDLETCN